MAKLIACALFVFALAGAASGDFIADGQLTEWGVTPGLDWQNDIDAAEWLETEVWSEGYVEPGYGGQRFNVEAMYALVDCDNLHYAIVTGFPDIPVDYHGMHYPGDIFFDIYPLYDPSGSATPTGTMEFAIETTTYDSDHPHGGMASENQGAGSFYSDVTVNLATQEWNGVYYPVEIKRTGDDRLASATLVGQTSFAYNDLSYGSNHYVIEGTIPLSLLGDIEGQSMRLWWTMTCANDIGKVCVEIPTCEIPEPGTLLLVGGGCLLGLRRCLRRRKG